MPPTNLVPVQSAAAATPRRSPPPASLPTNQTTTIPEQGSAPGPAPERFRRTAAPSRRGSRPTYQTWTAPTPSRAGRSEWRTAPYGRGRLSIHFRQRSYGHLQLSQRHSATKANRKGTLSIVGRVAKRPVSIQPVSKRLPTKSHTRTECGMKKLEACTTV